MSSSSPTPPPADDLKTKCIESDELRKIASDYEQQLREMDKVMEENLEKTQHSLDKSTKKYNALVEKFNDLQEKYMSMSVENEKLQHQLLDSKDHMQINSQQVTEQMTILRSENESLHAKIASLVKDMKTESDTFNTKISAVLKDNENLKLSIVKEREDKEVMQAELDELYKLQREQGDELHTRIVSVTKESEGLRRQNKEQVDVIGALNKKLLEMKDEYDKLRSVSREVHYTASIVSNTAIYNELNITNIENTLINTSISTTQLTTILHSVDIKAVKKELMKAWERAGKLYTRLRRAHDRLFDLSKGVSVYVRIRPPSVEETSRGGLVVDNPPSGALEVSYL
ncbi:hypothetical protein EON65_45640, partial [archaeon]